jgi:hypothetical protein
MMIDEPCQMMIWLLSSYWLIRNLAGSFHLNQSDRSQSINQSLTINQSIYAFMARPPDWLIDWLTDWLTDWLIDWLTDWLIDWWMDWLIKLLLASVRNSTRSASRTSLSIRCAFPPHSRSEAAWLHQYMPWKPISVRDVNSHAMPQNISISCFLNSEINSNNSSKCQSETSLTLVTYSCQHDPECGSMNPA